MSNVVLSRMSRQFFANKLALNLDKTSIIKFIMKNSPQHILSVGYKEKICKRVSKYKIPWSTD
jgi:hypothetical protein